METVEVEITSEDVLTESPGGWEPDSGSQANGPPRVQRNQVTESILQRDTCVKSEECVSILLNLHQWVQYKVVPQIL